MQESLPQWEVEVGQIHKERGIARLLPPQMLQR
jgi:hypothetical protein